MNDVIKHSKPSAHWLTPFLHLITHIGMEDGLIYVRIETTLDDLQLDTTPEALFALGIERFEFELPLRTINHWNKAAEHQRTGEQIIRMWLKPERNTALLES